MPVLVVGGGKTGWHPADEAERVACLPDVRQVELDGAGHMMHWTAPDALARTLTDFFGGGAAPATPGPDERPGDAGKPTSGAPTTTRSS
jgi:hypothetical protein